MNMLNLVYGDEAKFSDLAPPAYSVRSFPRTSRGGGIAFVVRDSLFKHATVNSSFSFQHSSFELAHLKLALEKHVNIYCLYRPPPSKKNKLTDALFVSEFSDFLEYCNQQGGNMVIVGDFNIHFDCPTAPTTARMIEILQTFGLIQSVSEQTHSRHILDWVLSRECESIVHSTTVSHEISSDHYPILCHLNVSKPPHHPEKIMTRNLRGIDRDSFKSDVRSFVHEHQNVSAAELHAHLSSLLDKHAPPTQRVSRCHKSSPWYSSIASEL